MCGIFGYIGQDEQSADIILDGLKTLEYRGYDSWGIAVKTSKGAVHLEKHVGKIGQATLPPLRTKIGIGHTRWATHGGVTQENAHPHTDCTGNVIIVHNGIVENFQELKKELAAAGHTFKSQTDSEVVAHYIEEQLKKTDDTKRVILNTFHAIHGLSAVIAFFPEKDELYIFKNSSPIVYGRNEHGQFICSDVSALVPHTKEAYFLQDGDVLRLTKTDATLFDAKGHEHEFALTKLDYDMQDASLGDYDHYMIKEISEQPRILTHLINSYKDSIGEYADAIEGSYGTYLVGCGTASYACLGGTYLFSKIAKRHVNFSIASEFSYLIDFIKQDSLVVALSQSGETIDVISTIQKVKESKAKVMAITNGQGSALQRLADITMLLHAGPEKAVASTKAYTAKITVLYMLAYAIAGDLPTGISHLTTAISEIERLLKQKEEIKKIAEQIKDKQFAFVLGRGVSYSAALESALKIKEVSYIHAEGFACGELKHGPIALIEKGTPVILYNPMDETYEDTLSAAHEVKARGAYVIGVSSQPNDAYDHFIQVENCGDATLLPNVVIAQLLGYYLALAKNLDPDKPRNLAKSVTVK